ncbi:hypothetical protein M8J75_011298 [Diaphorina citri]|nr:hypothetical protein M8J75_011298 [Diaphorina citri]
MRLDNGVRLGDGQPCFIIAEIGQNHQGDVEIAKQMIIKAKECGADCVKFQKSCLSTKFTQSALDRPYLSPHAWANTYGQHKQHLEFSQEEYVMLQQCADQVDIMFTASAMDQVSIEFSQEEYVMLQQCADQVDIMFTASAMDQVSIEFSEEEYVMLQQCADQVDIMFTASAMDQVSIEFSEEEYVMLQQCADQVDIMFTASAMDQVSIEFSEE